jgi:hypothetical protein
VAASHVLSSSRPTDWPSHYNRGGAVKKIFLVPVDIYGSADPAPNRAMRIAIELFLSSVRAGTAPCSRASVTRFTRSEDEGWEALELAGGCVEARGACSDVRDQATPVRV